MRMMLINFRASSMRQKPQDTSHAAACRGASGKREAPLSLLGLYCRPHAIDERTAMVGKMHAFTSPDETNILRCGVSLLALVCISLSLSLSLSFTHKLTCFNSSAGVMVVVAGMVVGADEGLKNVTEAARRWLGDNTLVVFTTDNGGMLHVGGLNTPLRGGKSRIMLCCFYMSGALVVLYACNQAKGHTRVASQSACVRVDSLLQSAVGSVLHHTSSRLSVHVFFSCMLFIWHRQKHGV
jgi:hypothetical protein